MRLAAFLLLLLLPACPAQADGVLQDLITAEDKARLAQFDEVKEKALKEARSGGTGADIRILNDAMAGTPLSTGGAFDATGKWSCRTIKMGGGLALTVYSPFRCSISDDGAGWFLKKLSGSQRTQGRFYSESDTRMIYLGAGHIHDEPPRKYGEDARENQIAVVERLGENRLVLQFPKPAYESDFDLLVLER